MGTIGEQIRARRQELKINQQEVADLAGISINTLGSIEMGTGNPGISSIQAVCEVLGLEIITKLKD